MEKRAIHPWRKGARNFNEIPPNAKEKQWFVKEILDYGEKPKDMAIKYNIKRKSLHQWVESFKRHGILRDKRGRPAILTAEVRKEIVGKMKGQRFRKTAAEFDEIVQNAHINNVKSYSNIAVSQIKPLSRRSLQRVGKKLDVRCAKAEQTTDARMKACSDEINAIATAVAHEVMVPLTVAELIFNAD